MTSVCELLPSGGGSGCGQVNNPGNNGYVTSYGHDPLGDLTSVSQSGQSRAYSYDGLGRMTSETNPETSQSGAGGTTNYHYDSVSDNVCPTVSNAGDLVERIDPAGNYSCYTHDGLHRLALISYPSGPNTANMPTKYFYYDQSSPWNISVNNPLGRLTLAATYIGQTSYSGEIFSYDARGEVTDLYEGTPHGGWYHTTQSYFANGAMASLEGFTGSGTTTPFSNLFTYNVDGKGRPYSMVDGGTTVWGSTSYYPSDQPQTVNAGGTETFAYDQFDRMTSWTSVSTAAGQQVGTLSWNSNGTLQQLQINDTTNNSVQTCGYAYDDVARLQSVNCGGDNWAQNFSYDAYGNITKSVPAGNTGTAFNPGYGSGNHVSGFSYDSMGNVTRDNLNNTYSYDAEGRPITSAGVQIDFDAFGRALEQDNGGVYTEIVYSPGGQKFAFMNWGSLVRYIDPMVGGMARVQNADGSSYFQHVDWLGSSRLGVIGYSGHIAYDHTYAPFGEDYDDTNSTNLNFTGQTQDTAAGLYDFLLRQYSPSQGRWLVPDPSGMAAVDITNPQTWNRYAYVGNNPLSNVDPLGLHWACFTGIGTCGWETDSGGGGGGGGGGGAPCTGCGAYGSGGGMGSGSYDTTVLGVLSYVPPGLDVISIITDGDVQTAGGFQVGYDVFSDNTGGGVNWYSYGSNVGGGGSGGSVAPSNPPTKSQCAGQAFKKNAVALTLDAAGVGAGFLPGGDLVVAGVQAGVSVASGINSAVHKDAFGGVVGVLGLPASYTVVAAKTLDVGAKAIPFFGAALSAVGALNDAYSTYMDYQACLAGH